MRMYHNNSLSNELVYDLRDDNVVGLVALQDNVYSCYEKMQEIEERKHMTPPPELAVPGPVVGSGSGAKRRLSFDNSDQPSSSSSPPKRMRRL